MAKKIEFSNPHVAAVVPQHKQLVPWCSASYNDVISLISLRGEHPGADWGRIRDMFHEAVAARWDRSIDSIKKKWRRIKIWSRKALELEGIELFQRDVSHYNTHSNKI